MLRPNINLCGSRQKNGKKRPEHGYQGKADCGYHTELACGEVVSMLEKLGNLDEGKRGTGP